MTLSASDTLNEFLTIGDEVIAFLVSNFGEYTDGTYDNHLAFMAYTFLMGQVERLQSMMTLARNGHYRDTETIVRTMIEGFAYLRFANELPEIRPLRWRAFAWVLDFRTAKTQPCDEEYRKQIFAQLENYQHLLLKPKYRNRPKHSLPEDPYIKDWCINEQGEAVSVKKILEEVAFTPDTKGFPYLHSAYADTSRRIHWELGKANVGVDESIIDYSSQDPKEAVQPMAIALICSLDAIWAFSTCLDLDFETPLTDLSKKVSDKLKTWIDERRNLKITKS